jgi:hypothetical protein
MDPWHSGMHAVRNPSMTRAGIDGALFFFLLSDSVPNMHGECPPSVLFFPSRLLLTMVLGRLKGGIGRLPRYVHGHSQCQCHGTEPAELQERDLPG